MSCKYFPKMAEVVRPGERGSARVDLYEVSQEESLYSQIRARVTGRREEYVSPGQYARLLINGEIMMSDTEMERRSNRSLMIGAHGRVLVGGLGLGMLVHGLVAIPGVEVVDVIELNPDVIALVQPTLPANVNVIEADVFTWKPTEGYDHVIFDIWPTISEDNLREMAKLKRRYRHWTALPTTRIACWSEDLVRKYRERRRNTGL